MEWECIAPGVEALEWNDRNLCIVEVFGKKITLARFKDQVFATAYSCPHAGAVMADGYIDVQGNIVCPLHRYKFSLEKGRNVSGEGYHLKTYAVKIDAEGVWIGQEKPRFLSWS